MTAPDRSGAAPPRGGPAGWLSGWRAALRIARRDAWRHRGRSVLVLAMIALPIFGVAAADIIIRSADPNEAQTLDRDLGAADARVAEPTGGVHGPLYQSPDTFNQTPVPRTGGRKHTRPRIEAVLPAGARWITERQGGVRADTRHGVLRTTVRELKAADPIAHGIMRRVRGRFPVDRGEVAATTAFLASSGLHVGSTVRLRDAGRSYRITGAYELPGHLDVKQLNAPPGAVFGEVPARPGDGVQDRPAYLVSVPGDYTWPMVKRANARGLTVKSRAVLLDPPARADVPYYSTKERRYVQEYRQSAADKAVTLVVIATAVSLAVLEICLLAGPAFAVGARRSRRQLGLVGVAGGDRRHIRAVVLGGGLVLGAAAAVSGLALAVGAVAVLRPLIEERLHARFGSFDLPPLELLGIAALAVVTGLLAALFPAMAAARQSVLASLTGRRGVRRTGRALPAFGAAAVGLGAPTAVLGAMHSDSAYLVGLGSGVAELGLVALTPLLVGLFGRAGRRLPLSPRLALRDAVRNRGRTAPAVAAVLAAVAGSVAVATYQASEDRQARDAYVPSAPYGVVSLQGDYDRPAGGAGRSLAGPIADVEKHLPVTGRADVSRIPSSMPVPEANECPRFTPVWDRLSTARKRKAAAGWRCRDRGRTPDMPLYAGGGPLIGGPDVLKALHIEDPGAAAALRRGEAVVFERAYLLHGKVAFSVYRSYRAAGKAADSGKQGGRTVSLPAHLLRDRHETYGVTVLVPPSAVRGYGVRPQVTGAWFTTGRLPTDAERQALNAAFEARGVHPVLHIEEGYRSKTGRILLILTLCAGLITLGAAAIATSLAQADAEPDLRTLSAVGAAPRVRRTLSGLQCGLIAAMGVVLGTAAGLVPAIGLRKAEERKAVHAYAQTFGNGWAGPPHVPVVVPWPTLAALLIAVPLGATLLAALVTRSRAV